MNPNTITHLLFQSWLWLRIVQFLVHQQQIMAPPYPSLYPLIPLLIESPLFHGQTPQKTDDFLQYFLTSERYFPMIICSLFMYILHFGYLNHCFCWSNGPFLLGNINRARVAWGVASAVCSSCCFRCRAFGLPCPWTTGCNRSAAWTWYLGGREKGDHRLWHLVVFSRSKHIGFC